MPALINLSGMRFGFLTVQARNGTANDGQSTWLCICDCGCETTVKAGNLRSGHTTSCGCFKKRRIHETQSIHMQSHKRLYNVWTSMKARCQNPHSAFFRHYGGRGIEICKEWKDDYQAFHQWAMENGYDPKAKFGECTIDRIDTDGNYCPQNCRWTDMKTQRHNRRDSYRGGAF